MRDARPRNLKEMISEAKNTSELMVDLAYAALFYNSEDFSEEVIRLERRLNDLVFDMRSLAIFAARSHADAEQMAGILQVVQDIEKIGNAATDIAKIVEKKLGIPPELLQDLPAAEEITSRVHIAPESALDGRSLDELDLPVETGMRPIAIRSGSEWNFDPEPEDVLRAGDVLFMQGPPEGVAEIREFAGAPVARHTPHAGDGGAPPEGLSELERAVDILIEMKNLSEVAVGLAYSALLYYDARLAREVVAIEDEMDEMRYRIERWVLLAARRMEDAPRLRGILHLATASETIADCAQEMVWIVEKGEEVHPVLSAAVGESDEIVLKLTVSPGSPADGRTLGSLRIETETGMYALAVNRAGRWTYRPRDAYALRGGDSLLVTGAPEGLEPLADLFGQELEEPQ
ncbi:potassium channel protein [Rubrobacter marinus]|uniref:Potassium channel protein n=1 Tax=Rubrobacter marinus TaxID=2653852 RepID=A0A6G8PYQ6_9ACTN|nr:TrkA C-terminal domain-containing protein [Rubrobacter marinus]QIN79326.1 potassium channel protein [Rubrobacter marinus]